MKIDVVTPSLSKGAGGVAPAVVNLYKNICVRNEGVDIQLRSLAGGESMEWGGMPNQIKLAEHARIPPAKLGLSPSLLWKAINTDADLVHAHGIWMMPTFYQNMAHIIRKTPFVVSPHGMLDPWILSRGQRQKKFAKAVYENYSWNNCAAFHALNASEADAIKQVVPNARVEVIPNGVSIKPDSKPVLTTIDGPLNILFLGRFHEKKNVHGLISAVNSISRKQYDKSPFVIKLAGWGDSQYVQQLQKLIAEGESCRFEWIGSVFGDEKACVLADADAFILPSFSEGLPVAILEAWAAGLPVLMSEFCNLPEAFAKNAALRIGTDVPSIANSLVDFLSLNNQERLNIALAGYEYVSVNYNWSVVSDQFIELYDDIIL